MIYENPGISLFLESDTTEAAAVATRQQHTTWNCIFREYMKNTAMIESFPMNMYIQWCSLSGEFEDPHPWERVFFSGFEGFDFKVG